MGGSSQKAIQHFLLTRFNLHLWRKDKEGNRVRTLNWLKHRFALFEHFCLPSVIHQTCKNFEWIVLFDSKTPDAFLAKIAEYKSICPQLNPVFVSSENGRFFASIFKEEIAKRMSGGRVLSTYLDNDDALNRRFVEDIQLRAEKLEDGTFIRYSDGYQYYTEGEILAQIHYPRNHFVSVIERGDPSSVKGIFGFGGHYYLDRISGATIKNILNLPMWCEVIHERNMINDANFLIGTKIVRDKGRLKRDFSVDADVKTGFGIFAFKFLPRYFKTLVKRARAFVFGRQW